MSLSEAYGGQAPCGAYNHFELDRTLEGCPHCRTMKPKKIRVPEGMLKAAKEAVVLARSQGRKWVDIDEGTQKLSPLPNSVEVVVEAALRWQDEQLEKMIQGDPYLNDPHHRSESMSEIYNRSGRNNAVREIRRMFLAPAKTFQIPLGLMGRTFTQEEADEIVAYVQQSVPTPPVGQEQPIDPLVMYIMRHFEGGEPDKRALRNRAEAAVDDYREHTKRNPSNETSSGIEDLLVNPVIGTVNGNQVNDRIKKAYRRGKESR